MKKNIKSYIGLSAIAAFILVSLGTLALAGTGTMDIPEINKTSSIGDKNLGEIIVLAEDDPSAIIPQEIAGNLAPYHPITE